MDNTDDTEIKSFLKIHNAVGTFLYFGDERKITGDQLFHLVELKDFVITDPQWLVDMCKEVITHPQFLFERKSKLGPDDRLRIHTLEELQKGYVTQESLKTLWGSDEAASFVIKLMLAFNLFIPLSESEKSGQEYLIPCMLPIGKDNHGGNLQEERVLLYNGVHKAGHGMWFHMGKFCTLVAGIIGTNNWKLSSIPFPTHNCISFISKENVCLQLSLESSTPNPNCRAMMYCSPAAVTNETLHETLKETCKILQNKTEQPSIEREEDLVVFCPYYGLQEEGLRLVLSPEQINKLKCPCHNRKMTKNDYICFKETYVCKLQNNLLVDYSIKMCLNVPKCD